MTAIKVSTFGRYALVTLLAGTVLSTMPSAADAQGGMGQGGMGGGGMRGGGHRGGGPRGEGPRGAAQPIVMPPPPSGGPAVVVTDPNAKKIATLRVEGSQRIEPETVLSYTRLRVGMPYNNELLDQAIKDLLASDLFADVSISGVESGDIVLRVRENPIINRVILEGNKRLKEDKITKEIKLKPRQIFTRTAVRQDVARIVELYRRQGRFAAAIEPKMVSLDQNRVDIIFEINEGPKSKVRQINILGNEKFSDKTLRGQMATKEARLTTMLSSNTSYDQDRLAYDQQKMRQFYLTNGYADFRVTSAVAELTPDKKDFIITYVVEEGKRYKFGDVTVDSDIRDFDGKKIAAGLTIKKGDWYDAKKVEDTVDSLNQSAGLVGYAFADTNPEFARDKDALTMGINFHIAESKRTYVERINVTGNTQTQDKVIRREIRLAEGDAFNSFQVKRSQDRINSLGFFQDKFEIKQSQGSAPDRVVLDANVEEKSTGELSLSAGYSSLESFIIQASITQRNFRGKGQELRASVNYSSYSKSIDLGFTEPYLFNKNIAIGGDIFRRDYNAFNYVGDSRQTTYTQVSTGFQIRAGIPLTEYWSLAARYGLTYDQVGLDSQYFNVDGSCNALVAGRYLCEAIGNRWTSSVGYSLIFDSLNSRLRPTAGQKFSVSQDFAGLGGDVRYVRTRFDATKYKNIGAGFIGSLHAEGGYIFSLEGKKAAGVDPIRITDRFYLGEPDFPGFDIRGVGPRVTRTPYTTDANGNQILVTDKNSIVDDALGGNKYYVGRLEVQIPLGSGARELGLRPSIYVQAGALWGVTRPAATVQGGFPTTIDPVTGRVTVQPLTSQVLDSNGMGLYTVPTTDGTNPGVTTTCKVGYSATSGGTCVGSSINTAYTTSTAPFLEQFLGDSAAPRISVGMGVNWNSPFGPLRIDLAYALKKVKGDDTKLVTFNVGTQF